MANCTLVQSGWNFLKSFMLNPQNHEGKMSDKDLLQRIEQYIEGELPAEEVESRWDELIHNPE